MMLQVIHTITIIITVSAIMENNDEKNNARHKNIVVTIIKSYIIYNHTASTLSLRNH